MSIFIFLAIRFLAIPLDLMRFFLGYLIFLFYKKTPSYGYQALISLHGVSKGYFSEVVHFFIRMIYPPVLVKPLPEGINLQLSEENLFLKNMKQKGYHIFEKKLPEEELKNLLSFSLKTQAYTKPLGLKAIYDSKNPIDSGYYYDEPTLIDNQTFQRILAGANFQNLAQKYLNSSVDFSTAVMWWSSLRQASDETKIKMAQMYHFDMDRIKWIKFFIYITPVDTNSGPHTLIEGTHRPGKQPWALLKYYYSRIEDSEVLKYFSPKKVHEVLGQAGSIIAVDTRAFHKGKVPLFNDRLILELEFSNSLFGAEYCVIPLDGEKHHILLKHKKQYPKFYFRYKI